MTLTTQPSRVSAAAFYGGQYIDLIESANLRPERTSPFSFSFWTFPSVIGYVFSNQNDQFGAGQGGPGIGILTGNDGNVHFRLWGTTFGQTTAVRTNAAPMVSGRINHVIVSYDGSSDVSGMTIRVNGVVAALTTVGSNNLASSIIGDGLINLGTRNNTSSPMEGYTSDFAFYEYELTATDALRIYNDGRIIDVIGLELSGADAFLFMRLQDDYVDTGTGGNAGTAVGYTTEEQFRNGATHAPPNVSLALDGVDQYGSIPNDSSLTFNTADPYTIIAWVAWDGVNQGYVLAKFNATPRGWGTFIWADGRMGHFQQDDAVNDFRRANTPAGVFPTDNKLHLAVFSYDGSSDVSGMAFLLDNQTQTNVPEFNDVINNYGGTVPITLGARTASSPTLFISGSMTWAAVYDRVLTSMELADIFDAGPFAPPPHTDRLLTTWFKNGGEKVTVPAFPGNLTLNNSPEYQRE